MSAHLASYDACEGDPVPSPLLAPGCLLATLAFFALWKLHPVSAFIFTWYESSSPSFPLLKGCQSDWIRALPNNSILTLLPL